MELTSLTEEAFLEEGGSAWTRVAPGVYQQTSFSGETTTAAFGRDGLAWERAHTLDAEHAAWLDEVEAGLDHATDDPPPAVDPLARSDMDTFTCAGDRFTVAGSTRVSGGTALASSYAGRNLGFGPAVPGSYVARADVFYTNGSGDSDVDSLSNGCCGVSASASFPVNPTCRMSAYSAAYVTYCGGQFASVLVGGPCNFIGF